MHLPRSNGESPLHNSEKPCLRRYTVLCVMGMVVTLAVAIPSDYGRYGDAIFSSPLNFLALPSMRAFVCAFLLSSAVLLAIAYRQIPQPKFRRVVWALAWALALCCLSAWFALSQAERHGEVAFAATTVILVFVSLPCALLVLVGVTASVIYAIRRCA